MIKYTVLLLGILLSQLTYSADYVEFNDLFDHKYSESVRYLRQAGVVKGYPDGSYGVDRTITRAEMMKIVLESKHNEILDPANDKAIKNQRAMMSQCYDDVNDEWYAQYICYASSKNMVQGIGNNNFGPEHTVTIAQGLKIALNAFGGLGVSEGKGDDWYQPYMDRAHNNNILSKYGVYPDQAMTRGMMAYLTHQLMLHEYGERRFDGVREVGSVGCGEIQPSIVTSAFEVNGVQRSAIVDIGSDYNPDEPTRLVIARHGRTNSNSDVRNYYKLNRYAKNAIVVYPSGLPEGGPSRTWTPNTDVALFDTIVHDISQAYCINQDEIYIIGHSLGAWWTNTLACMRGDVIRAMGSVGGSVTSKECSGPVAAIIMHHPNDQLASYAGGLAARDKLLTQNRCDVDSAKPLPDAPARSNCVQYNCMADAPVVWCPHTEDDTRGYYYPHTWPGFASSLIWDFWDDL